MKKLICKKALLPVFLLLIVYAVACKGVNEGKSEENEQFIKETGEQCKEYVRTANKVTAKMLSPEYWLDGQENIDELIMSPLEIKLWNKQYSGKSFWEGEDVTENAGYGYTVARADIRKEPLAEYVFEEGEGKYFCRLQISSILLNEPVLVLSESEDGKWYYIKCRYCEGWTQKENVAICENFQQWKANMEPENFLIITGDREILDVNTEYPEISEMILYMGTKLPLVEYDYYVTLEQNRVPYECYIVKIPIRDESGFLEYVYGFVPVACDVNVGYLPYTTSNLVKSMFKLNGKRYGWGGMYNARDCSQYVMDVYGLFGFEFARNSAMQARMNFEGYELAGMTEKEKKEILEKLPIGSLVYFKGHIMLYLGKTDGEYYVISETARISEGGELINAHSCMVTPLSVKRQNGNTWLRELAAVLSIR